jgi:hypothetical protein
MWECSNCSEEIDDDLDVCWNCQTAKDGSPPEAYFHQKSVPRELEALQERMSHQTDSDLMRIVDFDAKDYREEAIDLARAELERRGLLQPRRAKPKKDIKPQGLNVISENTHVACEGSNDGSEMRGRIFTILNILKEQDLVGLKDFREEDATSFEIKTPYAEQGHRTCLKYEPNNDCTAVRIELTHFFGRLDFGDGIDATQLLKLLSMNVPSFQNSSAYLGASSVDDTFLVSLNSSLIFLTKWSDEDIADALSIRLFDLVAMAFIFEMPPPIKQFRTE